MLTVYWGTHNAEEVMLSDIPGHSPLPAMLFVICVYSFIYQRKGFSGQEVYHAVFPLDLRELELMRRRRQRASTYATTAFFTSPWRCYDTAESDPVSRL
eukprot:jgi/Botrbrau1/15439/Bobra.43_2s0064.1